MTDSREVNFQSFLTSITQGGWGSIATIVQKIQSDWSRFCLKRIEGIGNLDKSVK